jgi:hypothetical protein
MYRSVVTQAASIWFNGVGLHPVVYMQQSKTNLLLAVEHNYIISLEKATRFCRA